MSKRKAEECSINIKIDALEDDFICNISYGENINENKYITKEEHKQGLKEMESPDFYKNPEN